jgi:hypothetical protein
VEVLDAFVLARCRGTIRSMVGDQPSRRCTTPGEAEQWQHPARWAACEYQPGHEVAGGTDWLSTDGAQRRVGLVHALPVIPVAKTPTGGLFDLAMYIPTGGVPVTGGTARSAGSTATPPLTTARTGDAA